MDEPAVVTWVEAGVSMTARWRSANGRPAPARVEVVSDSLTAEDAYRMASQGIAMLWHGDFHNARQILNAMDRRVGAGKKIAATRPISSIGTASPARTVHAFSACC